MPESNAIKTEKKIYSKPTITIVRLVAEEAVLAACKVVGGTQSACNPPDPTCTASTSGS